MSPPRPPPRPASRDWPGVMSLFPASRDCATAGGNAVHSSEASAFPALEKTGCGKCRQTPDFAFSGLSPAQSSVLSQLHSAARRRGFPETSHPSSRIRPTSEAALSADIRADFPQKTSALRKASCFSPPRVGTADAEQKITAKACFPSPGVKTAAPRVPPRPASRMTHVFDVPHGNDARALFFPPAAIFPPGSAACVLSSSVGRPAGLFGRKGGGVPEFSRSAQEHSA